ncbi:hypothetical protein N9M29_01660 [Alphaproteobacteria bacterium]|nr:hypothetical protein [Alphaproteobacteria bacterium]MDB2626261.1 hypothetical protein [Alphaproteobacteria bacterium]
MTRILTIVALLFATPAWAGRIDRFGREDGNTSEFSFILAGLLALIVFKFWHNVTVAQPNLKKEKMPQLALSLVLNGEDSPEFNQSKKEAEEACRLLLSWDDFNKIETADVYDFISKNRESLKARWPNVDFPYF